MKEYRITYISDEDGQIYEGCGRGFNGQDAVRSFIDWIGNVRILNVRFYADHSL